MAGQIIAGAGCPTLIYGYRGAMVNFEADEVGWI